MYSAILNDGRLRDLVNGHAPPPNHFFHSDAAWTGSSTLDGQLATGGQQLRQGVAALGGGSNGGINNRAVDFDFTTASNAAAAAKEEEESVDIRQILSTPLPPIPSDVEFIRSQTFASTGARFCGRFHLKIILPEPLSKITLSEPLLQLRHAHLLNPHAKKAAVSRREPRLPPRALLAIVLGKPTGTTYIPSTAVCRL